jgi:putative inorganic carbon (HCO3(-)) transporter
MSRVHVVSIVTIVALEVILPRRFLPPSRFLVATLILLLSWSLARELSRRSRWQWSVPIGAAVAAALAANWALALQPHRAVVTLTVWFLYLIVFLSVRDKVASRHDDLLLAMLAGIGCLCALWALDQWRFGFPQALDLLKTVDLPAEELFTARLESGRVFGPFILPSVLGSFLILILPVTTWLVVRSGRWPARIAWGVVAMLQIWALFLTRSHGAFLALATALGLVALLHLPRRLRLGLGGAAVAVFILLAAVVVARGGILLDPADPRGPIGQRYGVWQSAAAMVWDHPLFGVGGGGFEVAFPQHRVAGIDETRYAHNSYLQLVAEYGLWVVVPLALFLVDLIRRLRRPGSGDTGRIFIAAGCGAFLIHNLVDFSLYLPAAAVPFILMLGMLYRRTPDRKPEPPPAAAIRAVSWWPVAVAIGFWVVAGLWYLSDREIVLAQSAADRGDREATVRRLDRSIAFYPWRPRGWGLLAEVQYAAAGNDREMLERARQTALGAVDLDPFTPFRHHLAGLIAFSLGDDSAAYVSLRRAARLYPLKEEYRESLRVVEARIGGRNDPGR